MDFNKKFFVYHMISLFITFTKMVNAKLEAQRQMGWLLGKSGFENFLTKIKILLHFNLIVIKIKMQ